MSLLLWVECKFNLWAEEWKATAKAKAEALAGEENVRELTTHRLVRPILGAVLVLVFGLATGWYRSVSLCVLSLCVVSAQHQRESKKKGLRDVTIKKEAPKSNESTFVARLRMLYNAEWTSLSRGPPMDVSTRDFTLPSGKRVTGYRYEVLRPNVDASMILKTLGDRSNWGKIDPNLAKVTMSKHNPTVFKFETHRIAVVAPRVAYVSSHTEEHDTKHYVGFMGVQTDEFGRTTTIEATVWIDATIVEQTAEGCRCVYFSVMDPNVWVPIPHTLATRIVCTRLANLESLAQGVATCGKDDEDDDEDDEELAAPEALCASTLNHASWRSVSQEDFITMWEGRTKGVVRIRGSMILKGNAVLLQKLVSLPSLQYELASWLSKSDTVKSHGGIRYAEEVWRLPSPFFGTTTRKHSIRYYDPVQVDDRVVVAMRSSESNRPGHPNQVEVLPSGWVINSLGHSSDQSHVEFVIQFSYQDMPASEYVSAWGRRRVQRMLQQLRRLS